MMTTCLCRGALCASLLLFLPAMGLAETWHVDPVAEAGGDGSAGRPFISITAAIQSDRVAGGDTIELAAGAHGALVLTKVGFKPAITITSDPAAPAHFTRIKLDNTWNITIDGGTVWDNPGPIGQPFAIEESGVNNVLRNLDIRSVETSVDYRSWDKNTWLSTARNGIRLRGRNATAENNRMTGIREGIAATGDNAQIIGNVIYGFSADALRAIGDDALVRGNYVTDCFNVDDNHDDAFQSWATGPKGPDTGSVKGLVIEGNTFLEWSGPNPDHPLRGPLQGIGMFDGPYENTVIANNIIAVSAYHAIAVFGMIDGKIVNNTVMSARGISRERPWITIGKNRDGTLSEGSLVANNVAPRFLFGGDEEIYTLNTIGPNFVTIYPHQQFSFDPALPLGVSIRLKPGSSLSGTADPAHAPATDLTGAPRDGSDGIDPGAFEGAS